MLAQELSIVRLSEGEDNDNTYTMQMYMVTRFYSTASITKVYIVGESSVSNNSKTHCLLSSSLVY